MTAHVLLVTDVGSRGERSRRGMTLERVPMALASPKSASAVSPAN